MSGPLSGIKVVEICEEMGEWAGKLLADMGAEVVKIEPPERGDPMRAWGQGDKPTGWRIIARNKYSVAADLKTKEGQDLARKLILKADILIENFRPGTLERWALDPEKLLEQNAGLIVVRISGYGQYGPYSSRAGFGGIAEAMGGWRKIVGEPDRVPARMGLSIGDTLAASYGCVGALAALHERKSSGKGQVVDVALYESVLQVMESLIPEWTVNGHKRERTGSKIPGVAPSNVYRCRDGDFMIGANQDSVYARLCEAMGRPELATDERFADHLARARNQDELDAIIEEWTKGFSIEELDQIMIEYGVPAGRIYDAEDMLSDPHFAAREAIIEVDDPEFGQILMQNAFPKLSRTPSGVRRSAPMEIGQDAKEVMERWLDD